MKILLVLLKILVVVLIVLAFTVPAVVVEYHVGPEGPQWFTLVMCLTMCGLGWFVVFPAFSRVTTDPLNLVKDDWNVVRWRYTDTASIIFVDAITKDQYAVATRRWGWLGKWYYISYHKKSYAFEMEYSIWED